MDDERPRSLEALAEAVALYESELGRAYETWQQGDRRAAAEAAVLAARSLAARLGFGIAATPLTMLAGGVRGLSSGKGLDWLEARPEARLPKGRPKQDKNIPTDANPGIPGPWGGKKKKA